MTFSENLERGKVAESAIARWLMRRGHSVLPVYEKSGGEYKGPQLFTHDSSFVAPDMVAFANGQTLFIEAKHKSAFTFWRIGGVFETGINLCHYFDYIKIRDVTKIRVWLLFLHKGCTAKDSPPSPAGLFGNDISILERHESHRDTRWGSSGMVYWTRDVDGGPLRKIAEYEDVII